MRPGRHTQSHYRRYLIPTGPAVPDCSVRLVRATGFNANTRKRRELLTRRIRSWEEKKGFRPTNGGMKKFRFCSNECSCSTGKACPPRWWCWPNSFARASKKKEHLFSAESSFKCSLFRISLGLVMSLRRKRFDWPNLLFQAAKEPLICPECP